MRAKAAFDVQDGVVTAHIKIEGGASFIQTALSVFAHRAKTVLADTKDVHIEMTLTNDNS